MQCEIRFEVAKGTVTTGAKDRSSGGDGTNEPSYHTSDRGDLDVSSSVADQI
jgi:hypothetical protein